MNRVKLTIAAGAFAVAMFGAASASARSLLLLRLRSLRPRILRLLYYPYSYAPVVEYYAPRDAGGGYYGGYYGGCY